MAKGKKEDEKPTTSEKVTADEKTDHDVIPTQAARVNLAPALNFYGRQIEELLVKVISIEEACLGSKDDKEDAQDEFIKIKNEIYACLFVNKQMIRERSSMQSSLGNTVDVIQKGILINKNNELMSQKFISLKEAFRKQAKLVQKKFTAAELDVRFKELQVVKRQIDECVDLLKRGAELPEARVKTLTDFLGQMEKAGVAPPTQFDAGTGGGWREPSLEEQAAMNRWAARDKEFDAQIWQVGETVDRLNVLAVEFGNKASQQGKMALDLSRQADEANQEVVDVNNRLKDIMMCCLQLKGPGLNFCCKLLLTIILMGELAFIINDVIDRVKGSLSPFAMEPQAIQAYSATPNHLRLSRSRVNFSPNPEKPLIDDSFETFRKKPPRYSRGGTEFHPFVLPAAIAPPPRTPSPDGEVGENDAYSAPNTQQYFVLSPRTTNSPRNARPSRRRQSRLTRDRLQEYGSIIM